MKVVVSGGGTGGHTLPVIAVINALNELNPNNNIIFLGSRMGIESRLVPKLGVKYYGINAGKFRRYHRSMILNVLDPTTLFKNIKDLFNFLAGIKEAREILLHERPDVVFAKGGYVSLPVGIAARLVKVPLVIHESDLIMGLSNKKMAGFASRVCISFEPKFFPEIEKEKLVFTGNPTREDIRGGRGEEFKSKIGFDKKRKTILILGGSQGSQFINDNILKIMESLLDCYQILWIAGERDADLLSYDLKKTLPKEMLPFVKIYSFVSSELADLYDAADLVISRAGSNVLFEIATLGKPVILIPLGTSAGGHQAENARYFSRNGAASIFNQANFDSKKLLKHINYLFENPEELGKMSVKIKGLSKSNAAMAVAKTIYKEGEEHIEESRKTQIESS